MVGQFVARVLVALAMPYRDAVAVGARRMRRASRPPTDTPTALPIGFSGNRASYLWLLMPSFDVESIGVSAMVLS